MSDQNFVEIEACVFDAYGTLFDVHSAAARLRDDLGEKSFPRMLMNSNPANSRGS